MQIPQDQVPQPPANPIAHHRGTDRAAHDETDSSWLIASALDQQVADQDPAAEPAAAPYRRGELRPTAHPRSRRQHGPSPPRRRRRGPRADRTARVRR
jgi:hypothetical protein